MSDVNSLVLTLLAALALACALLGVMMQWLKSEARVVAQVPGGKGGVDEQAALHGPLAAVAVQSETQPGIGGAAGTAGAEASAREATKEQVLDVSDTGELEAYISRHLVAYGGAATAIGMVSGWFLSSFAGALAGAVVGTTVGVLTGTAVAAYRRRRG